MATVSTRPGHGPRLARSKARPSPPLRFDPIAEAERQWRLRWTRAADEMAAAMAITRAHQIILGAVDSAISPYELTFARYETLVLLYFSRKGRLPLGKMGVRLQVHPTSVTNSVDRLEAQGLIRRLAHPTDRRTTLAEITPKGRRVVQRATARLTSTGFAMSVLSLQDLRLLKRVLRKLRALAGDFEEQGSAGS